MTFTCIYIFVNNIFSQTYQYFSYLLIMQFEIKVKIILIQLLQCITHFLKCPYIVICDTVVRSYHFYIIDKERLREIKLFKDLVENGRDRLGLYDTKTTLHHFCKCVHAHTHTHTHSVHFTHTHSHSHSLHFRKILHKEFTVFFETRLQSV